MRRLRHRPDRPRAAGEHRGPAPGRTETRTRYATGRLSAHLARYTRFPAIGQVACLLPAVAARRGRASHREARCLLTSLAPQRADPARLLARARGHWAIESRHWARDATFGEDRSRLRRGHAPRILAALRNLARTLIRRLGTPRIAAQRRTFAARPAQALRLLGLRPA